AGAVFKSFSEADVRIVSLHDPLRLEQLAQPIDDQLPSPIHRERQRLEHQIISVAIHDHPWQSVAFAPDDAAEPFIHPVPSAVSHGALDLFMEQKRVELMAAPRKPAGHDWLPAIVNRGSQKLIIRAFQG